MDDDWEASTMESRSLGSESFDQDQQFEDENAHLVEQYLNPLIESFRAELAAGDDPDDERPGFNRIITRPWVEHFLNLSRSNQLVFVRDALDDPDTRWTRNYHASWLRANAGDPSELGLNPPMEMPEYLQAGVEDENEHTTLHALSTREDLLPLYRSSLSNDLLRNEFERLDQDHRVEDNYGREGVIVEALSTLDYNLPIATPPSDEEPLTARVPGPTAYGAPMLEAPPVAANPLIPHATQLPIYNIPPEDRVRLGLLEQTQANDTPFFGRHDIHNEGGWTDVQIADNYEDTIRYAGVREFSPHGNYSSELPIIHANYQEARTRDQIERRERDTRAVRVRDLIRERRNRNLEYF